MILAALWVGVVMLVLITIMEIWWPAVINEGFSGLVSIGDSAFWSSWMPRRGDIGDEEEEAGYVADKRYFGGYTDVQRLGVNHDYCRMLVPKGGGPADSFFACALAGTDGLSTTRYRTKIARDGFEMSRDDYMGAFSEGRVGYCRILKEGGTLSAATYVPKCNIADTLGFSNSLTIDTAPPPQIQRLVQFYQGAVWWLRFRDDMLDYTGNVRVWSAGEAAVDEAPPKPEVTRGLGFNGANQYLRIGENKDLEFGNIVQLRFLRAVSLWIYFDEFTNNAHVFDFGNGPGKDNVWLGILGRGNAGLQSSTIRPLLCGGDSTLPDGPSGAQPVEVCTPQQLMEGSAANVNDYTCVKPEVFGRIMPPLQPKASPPGIATTADLIYEVWDHQQRRVHFQIKNAVELKKWTHVVVTATTADAAAPILAVYINGRKVHEEEGVLPQTNYMTKNYIGKSSWDNVTSMYENADELFKGRLFDFRGYRTPMPEKKIEETYRWGRAMLGLEEAPEMRADNIVADRK